MIDLPKFIDSQLEISDRVAVLMLVRRRPQRTDRDKFDRRHRANG
ncbi:hypothetical protein RFM41_33310 [Mesorhizobium sp. VK25A]|uniref:Uncharacterized protein n=1 Tax=Mesorhizobium vachelliae TaxID=3072309 RepID=A0ABU5AF14_9HYPH|nr:MULTISPECIES: hypothetical protein [unclassified Mesorhizobium]MDX8535867.1 hypothetical protein [Mesorhizobium sp. VK25D]MDX8548621.1 hypothetical protein [Mesorhizobium sp. VK25A]